MTFLFSSIMLEKKYDFDEYINRYNTRSEKWDGVDHLFQEKNLLPLWVADMDFLAPRPIIEAIINRAKHGIFGYTITPSEYYKAVITNRIFISSCRNACRITDYSV